MTFPDYEKILPEVIEISHGAGDLILEIYDAGFSVETKEDGSPLTTADQRSHDYILSRLTQLTPGTPTISEESRSIEYASRKGWKQYWLVDPLDGTKEFVRRSGEFTVNIALIQANKPVLGVVHTPVKRWTHWGIAGGGAWLSHDGEEPRRIHVRHYSGGEATIVASRSHGRGPLKTFLDRLEESEGPYKLANMGSALKICLVAEGAGDLYPRFGPTGEWDTAAADIVLREAGGKLVDVQMQALEYNKEILLNPSFLACCAGDYQWQSLLGGLDNN